MSSKISSHLDRLRDAREHAQEASSQREVEYILGRRYEPNESEVEFDYGRLSFDTSIIYNEFTELITENVTRYIESVTEDGKDIVEFDIRHSNRERTPIQYIRLDRLPAFARLGDISSGDMDLSITTFSDDRDSIEITVLRVKAPGGGSVLGIQEYQSRFILGSSMFSRLIRTPGEEHYDKFEQEVIGIPEQIRAVVYDGYLYSDSPKSLERIFDFETEYEEEVTEVVDGLEENGIKLDLDDSLMDTLKSDIRHLRKFHEMKEFDIHQKATHDTIRDIVEERDLPIHLEMDDGEMTLSVESGNDRWELLDLLADDHVMSEMTGNPYNAQGKQLVDD